MNKKVCAKCGEPKPEIAFELGRNEEPRKVCRECRSKQKRVYNARARCKVGQGAVFGANYYLRGLTEDTY